MAQELMEQSEFTCGRNAALGKKKWAKYEEEDSKVERNAAGAKAEVLALRGVKRERKQSTRRSAKALQGRRWKK